MSHQLNISDIENTLQGMQVPSQPQVLVDLQMEGAMPDPDLRVIAGIINKDAGLAGSILKVANSSFYGHNGNIDTIAKAIQLLGFTNINNIVNTICLRTETVAGKKLSNSQILRLNLFWESAIDIAMCAEIVAQQVRLVTPEKAYMLGLFHNSGITLMLQKFDRYDDVMAESYGDHQSRIVDIENNYFDTNHAVVGYFIAKSWKLPKTLCRVIANHHSAQQVFTEISTPDEEYRSYLGLLKIAEHLANFFNHASHESVDYEWECIKPFVLEYLGLSEYDYEDLKSQCREIVY